MVVVNSITRFDFRSCAAPLLPHPLSSSHLWRHYSSASENKSFIMNSFLGKMETSELFPFPDGMIRLLQ